MLEQCGGASWNEQCLGLPAGEAIICTGWMVEESHLKSQVKMREAVNLL